jgi:putative phosphoesterase
MNMSKNNTYRYRIGVISDTHGCISENLPHILKNIDFMIHAGDIDNPDTLESLKSIAPVIAVRGNMDKGEWTKNLCQSELVEIGEVALYVVHNIYDLDIDPHSINVKAVISGHTHLPSLFKKGQVLYVNPGSATQPRNGNPPTVAIIQIKKNTLTGQLVEIPE